MHLYDSARDMFEAAREAALDAERIRRQLAAMESADLSLGGGGFEPRVRSTPDPDRMGRAVASHMEQAERLLSRQEDDYRLIDAACTVLYGTDSEAGLWALVGWRADALYHHYLALRTWAEVGELLGYSAEHCCREAMAALETADAWGWRSVVEGRGQAT